MPTIYVQKDKASDIWEKAALFFGSGREVTDEILAKIEAILEPPKSLAQQIREQLEREEMTVKQILAKNISCRMFNEHENKWFQPNALTPHEATRRYVERAAEIVREREPGQFSVAASYNSDTGEFETMACQDACFINEIRMQSTAQWTLLREVVGEFFSRLQTLPVHRATAAPLLSTAIILAFNQYLETQQ